MVKEEHARSVVPRDRRHAGARRELVRRVRAEFEKVPGLCLSLAQATRVFGVESDVCTRIFAQLLDEDFLRLSPNGCYVSRSNLQPTLRQRLPGGDAEPSGPATDGSS